MDWLGAFAAAQRVLIIILALAAVVGLRRENWCVIVRCEGWRRHLASFNFTLFVVGTAVISSGQIFPELGQPISRELRLTLVNIGLALVLTACSTWFYRRALRAGPEKARAAMFAGLSLLLPSAGLVTLLALRGANG